MPTAVLRVACVLAVVLSSAAGADAARRPRVVACSTVVFDILRHVGGDRVDAQCLLKAGVDPHSYQPVPEDARRLAGADLVIVNGLGFEGWAEALLKESGYAGRVVTAANGVAALTMASEDRPGQAVSDPHAFNDLANGVRYAENIRDALVSLDAAGAADYQAWAEAYIGEMRLLDGWVKRQVARIPPDQRRLVTDHDALQYFAKAYGFAVLAPDTALEDSQPGAQQVAKLVSFIKAQRIKGVFLEQDKNPKLVEQIAREAGVVIGGDLYLDGLAAPGMLADSYQGMFLANVRTIVRTLQ